MPASNMPIPGARDAPSYDGVNSRECGRYFRTLDRLFQRNGVTDDQEKKEFACDYVSYDIADVFTSTEEYTGVKPAVGNAPAGPYSYDEFKAAVFVLYPGAADSDQQFTMDDLRTCARDMLAGNDYSRDSLADFERKFQARFRYLAQKNLISESQAIEIYTQGFPTKDLDRLGRRLEIQNPNRSPEIPYQLKDVMAAAKFVFHPNTAQPFRSFGMIPLPPAPVVAPAPTVKAEDLAPALAALFRAFNQAGLVTPTAGPGQGPSVQNGPYRPRPEAPPAGLMCHYCHTPGHIIRDCQACQEDLQNGQIRRNATTRNIELPDGSSIPRSAPGANASMRDRVRTWHLQNSASTNFAGYAEEDLYVPSINFLGASSTMHAMPSEFVLGVDEEEDPYLDDDAPILASYADPTPPGSFALHASTREAMLLRELATIRQKRQALEAHMNAPEAPGAYVGTRANPARDDDPRPLPRSFPPRAARQQAPAAARVPTPAPAPATASAPAPQALPPRQAVLRDPSSVPTDPRAPNADVHPFRNSDGATYDASRRAPPEPQRNTMDDAPTRPPPREPAPRNQAPITDEAAAARVMDQALDVELRIKQRDLLAIAPGLRSQLKELVTARRVNVEAPGPNNSRVQALEAALGSYDMDTLDELAAMLDQPVEPPESSHGLYLYGLNELGVPDDAPPNGRIRGVLPISDPSDLLRVGKVDGAIRAVRTILNNSLEVYPILDPGAQIVAMSEAVATHAGIGWNDQQWITLQSANGGMNRTLGLAKNVPFTFGEITVYLQCHITRNPAYDILLGRPFNILCETGVRDFAGEHQILTLRDPNNKELSLSLATEPRRPIRFRLPARIEPEPQSDDDSPPPRTESAHFQRAFSSRPLR